MLFYHIIVALAATMTALPVLAAPMMQARSDVARGITSTNAYVDGSSEHQFDRRFGLFGIGTSKHKAGHHASKAVKHKLKAEKYAAAGNTVKAQKYRNKAAVHESKSKLHSDNYRAKHNILGNGGEDQGAEEGGGGLEDQERED